MIHEGNYNLVYTGLPTYSYDGVSIFNDDHKEYSHHTFEYFIGSKDGIIKRDMSDIDRYPDEIFYFVYVKFQANYNRLINLIDNSNHDFRHKFIEIITKPNVRTIIADLHEIEPPEDTNRFINKLKSLGVNPTHINLIDNDSNTESYIKKYKWDIDVYKTSNLISWSCHSFMDRDFSLSTDKPGPFFLCKNRIAKPHRISMLAFLTAFNLIEDTNFSLLSPDLFNGHDYHTDMIFLENPNALPYVYEYIKSDPIKTKWESHRMDFFDDDIFIDYAGDLHGNDYSNSYINITTESVFFQENIHITEKSFKPFSFYQLPIFLASPGHVGKLRDYYKMDLYDDFIDHSYDNEIDNSKRFLMVFDEIKRLYKNKDQVVQYYKNNEDRLIYNRNKCSEFTNSTIDFHIFKSILDKDNIH